MQKIFVLLRSRTGHDFVNYKSSTIRGASRGESLHQIKAPNQYVRFSRRIHESTPCSGTPHR
jgi:two-component system CheB/CheR fusion protein